MIFKCKICGGSLAIDGTRSVAVCEYCGTKQALPRLDDGRRANLYDRANHFRRNNEFDKAMGIYEMILAEDSTDAEAYWSIVLCRYGIEYVEDPVTHTRVPTVNRTQFTAIFDDEDYKGAIAHADAEQREIYKAQASAINEIQKNILVISQKEEPFDVFICYKESDGEGKRTKDSVLASELYHELTREGFKVFLSAITLEDKLGNAYEPYIFAALHSAKVMVVLGTEPRYLNAPWVKNEWSRYLALAKNGAKKTLIPAYRDMDPYDLPEEFSHLQAQDMAKLGFMQDLIRGIHKLVDTVPESSGEESVPLLSKEEQAYQNAITILEGARDIPTCQRAKKLFLALGDYRDAARYVDLCQAKTEDFQEQWRLQRIAFRENEANRKRTAKRIRKKALIILLCVLLSAFVLTTACLSIFGILIPHLRYLDARSMVENGRYDEAISLFEKAKEGALLEGTVSKIERAIEDAISQKEQKEAIERALITFGKASSQQDYEKVLTELLQLGVCTQISYHCEGQQSFVPDQIYIVAEAFAGMPTPVRQGYGFVKWDLESSEYQESEGILTVSFQAVWNDKEYTIEYDLKGGSAKNPTAYSPEDESITLAVPTKKGYTFLGWTGSGLNKPTMEVSIAKGSYGNLSYTANWQVNSYKVTFDAAGGIASADEMTYVYHQDAKLPTATREHFKFAGWYSGTKRFGSGIWTEVSDLTLTAKWEPIVYTVTYDLGGVPANNYNPTEYTVVTNTINLRNMSYAHCTFEGWYSDADYQNKVTIIPKGSGGNIKLYAKWEFETFTVSYDLNGGSKTPSLYKTTLTVADLPFKLGTATKSGHSFYYWAEGELDGEIVTEITEWGDRHFVANYLPDGLEVKRLSGGGRSGYWWYARYSGNAEELEIPKYQTNLSWVANSPCIQEVYIMTAPNLKKISFSNAVTEINMLDIMQYSTYQNGKYAASRSNPYHTLVGKVDDSLPLTVIHEDTVYIGGTAFRGDTTLTSIVIPKSVQHIGSVAFANCTNLKEVYNLSALDIGVGDTSYGLVAYYADAVYKNLPNKQEGD